MQETPPQPAETGQPIEAPVAEATAEVAPAAAPEVAPQPAPGSAAAPTDVAPEPAVDTPVASPAAPAVPAVPELSPAACAAALAERFPALFTAGKPLPIKLRIQADIQERAPGLFSRKSLSLFLHRHTTGTPYIKALLAAQTRFDLDGQPAGEIAAEHREAAQAELERRRAIVQAKRQAERQAQRPPLPAGDIEGAAPPVRQHPSHADRPARPPRPDAPNRAPRGDRAAPRPALADRPARHQRPPHAGPTARPAARPEQRQPRAHAQPHPQRPPAPPAVPLSPEQAADQEARRARAMLLRAFETSTLSRANFCALKRITEDALEAQLQQARAERDAYRAEHQATAAPPKR